MQRAQTVVDCARARSGADRVARIVCPRAEAGERILRAGDRGSREADEQRQSDAQSETSGPSAPSLTRAIHCGADPNLTSARLATCSFGQCDRTNASTMAGPVART
jgi:hypothetical protein